MLHKLNIKSKATMGLEGKEEGEGKKCRGGVLIPSTEGQYTFFQPKEKGGCILQANYTRYGDAFFFTLFLIL